LVDFFFAKNKYPGVKISNFPPSTKSRAVEFKIELIATDPFGAIPINSRRFTKMWVTYLPR
jgi:hypothetical protein